ncbi:MAG TPA: shikimate kinase [Candidatus Sulfotelmatobacter sp.]|nr:shikimate kinase [Candidatus Sulfotelmatobacter sp.]
MNVRDSRPIALIGLMGAGKTAVARCLGERLGVSVADLDSLLEAETGRTIAELFEREGEAVFRQREGQLLERVLADGVKVIACGGGIVVDPRHRELLRGRCDVIWLGVSPGRAAQRLAGETAARPLLQGDAPVRRLERLLGERESFYRETAHHLVDTEGLDPDAVAKQVLAVVGAAR